MSELPKKAKAPVEALMRSHPSQVTRFLDGATTIRSVFESRDNNGRRVIEPLRGAMPFIWASKGDASIEDQIGTVDYELPLGNYVHVSEDGKVKVSSPSRQQKVGILKEALSRLSDDEAQQLLLIDEVQRGGTLSTATSILEHLLRKRYSSFKLGVIAVQDSRSSIMSQDKTDTYKQIASNSYSSSVQTHVIPMPLVTTDRDPLLDTVHLSGRREDERIPLDRFTVVRNAMAETLLRGLGTVSRHRDVRHDNAYMQSLIDSQGSINESSAGKVEEWIPRLIAHLDEIPDRRKKP